MALTRSGTDIPFHDRRFCTIGVRMRINATDRSHIKPNNTTGRSSWNLRLFTSSRIMNSNARADDRR